VAGREGKRGECQTRLGSVWREIGAVRSARPSRGQAAPTRKRTQWRKDGVAFQLRLDNWIRVRPSRSDGGKAGDVLIC